MRSFGQVPTAQKCCKKQYEINIFVWRDQKETVMHECNPRNDPNLEFAKKTCRNYDKNTDSKNNHATNARHMPIKT